MAAGMLTVSDIRNDDIAACTLLPRAKSPAPVGEAPPQHPAPVASRVDSPHARQQDLERLMAEAIATRRR
jgi:hypothetical protein